MADFKTRDPFYDPEWRRKHGIVDARPGTGAAALVGAIPGAVEDIAISGAGKAVTAIPNAISGALDSTRNWMQGTSPGASVVKAKIPVPMAQPGGGEAPSPVVDTVPGTSDESPATEMDALKSRFGLGSRAVDPEQDASARQAFLSRASGQNYGIQEYLPEQDTGGDYLAIMSRDSQNRAIGDSNRAIVGQQESEDARREAAVQNALRQDAAQQALEAKRQEAQRLQEFFATTGLPPSPQAAEAFSRERGRQTAAAQFSEAIKGLIVQKESAYKKLLQGYEQVPEAELPPVIRDQMQRIDQKYQDLENKIVLAAGLMSGTNNPGNMISKDQVTQLVP